MLAAHLEYPNINQPRIYRRYHHDRVLLAEKRYPRLH